MAFKSTPSDVLQPHGPPTDNGAGGEPDTHDCHADCVPTGGSYIGRGMADADSQTAGNSASKQYALEHDLRLTGPDAGPYTNSLTNTWPATQGGANMENQGNR